MSLYIGDKEIDSVDSNKSEALKFIRSLNSNDDLNNIDQNGIYRIWASNLPKNNSTYDNMNNPNYWTLVVVNHDDGQVHQIAFSEKSIAFRYLNHHKSMMNWEKLVKQSDYDTLKSRIDKLSAKIGGVFRACYLPLRKEVIA